MSSFTLEVEKFQKSLEEYDEYVREELKAQLKKCALAVERDSKINLVLNDSVISGTLKNSIVTDLSNIEKFECEVGTNIEYAWYVEYGTYRSREKPYLRPAYHTNTKKLVTKIKKILGGK